MTAEWEEAVAARRQADYLDAQPAESEAMKVGLTLSALRLELRALAITLEAAIRDAGRGET